MLSFQCDMCIYISSLHPESSEITYASWMAYNAPGMILCVFAAWLLLQIMYVPWWSKQDAETKDKIREVIGSRYKELGPMSFHEGAVLTLFIVLIFLWIFREPKFMNGWADVLPDKKRTGDSVPAICILILMFLLPSEPWRLFDSPTLLTWKVVQRKLPWGLFILLGGGYALADGAKKSGLSKWMGQQMGKLFFLPQAVVLLLMCIFSTALTEIMSNSTVITLIAPIMSQMAVESKINPLLLMLPVTVVSSYAFMLPVATGSNAIIGSIDIVRTIDMMKPGVILKVITCTIQMFMVYTLGEHMFNLSTFPDWAKNSTRNST